MKKYEADEDGPSLIDNTSFMKINTSGVGMSTFMEALKDNQEITSGTNGPYTQSKGPANFALTNVDQEEKVSESEHNNSMLQKSLDVISEGRVGTTDIVSSKTGSKNTNIAASKKQVENQADQ